MKKSNLLLCASALALLASCGGGGNASSHDTGLITSDPGTTSHDTGLITSDTSHDTGLITSDTSHDTGLITSAQGWKPSEHLDMLVWCAEAATDLTSAQVQEFIDSQGWTDLVDFEVEAVGEGTAAGNVITDVDSAADVYFFAQDQLSRLVAAGGLVALTDEYAADIKARDNAWRAAAAGDTLYAFPCTADNGYYLYYDTSRVSADDVKLWDDLVTLAEAQKTDILFNYSSAWYNFGFFFGAGADSIWETDDDGNFIAYDDTYNSAQGLVGAKGMANLIRSSSVIDKSSASDVTDSSIALVSGTWDYNAMVDAWGENLGCIDLPAFTVGGTNYHTGSFSGNKLVGAKPQTDPEKAFVAQEIANYLTDAEAQIERFDELKWGPSNNEAASSEAVQSAPQIVALSKQGAYAKPQGQFPGGWWDFAGAIGSSIQGADDASDATLQGILDTYHAGLEDFLSK